jgi:hypothetical protein
LTAIQPGMWRSALDLQLLLTDQGFQFCFIGGIAVQRWGEPRVTADLDLTLITGFGTEKPFVQYLLEKFSSRIEDAEQFAMHSRVLMLEDARGTAIDVSLGALPYEERVVARSSLWGTPQSGAIRTCCAEDLMVLKAFADRPRDWEDIRTILIRQGKSINRSLVVEELTPLAELKEEPEILTRLEQLLVDSDQQ